MQRKSIVSEKQVNLTHPKRNAAVELDRNRLYIPDRPTA